MFSKFNEESRKVLIDSKKEMAELKHPYIGSEHLILSILKNSGYKVTKILNKNGINYDNFKRETLFEFPFTEQGMQDAYKKEEELVNPKFLKRKDVYNRALGGKLTFLSRKRKIAQYTLSGKFLKIYESI